jgi:hypothetical protein
MAFEALHGEIGNQLQRLKWFLWHGNVVRALHTVEDITADLETLHPDGEPTKLLKAVREFDSYLRVNAERIPNYGEHRRVGEAISTAFTESAVNQVISKRMVKKNSRCAGHHAAPPATSVRNRVLNDQLAGDFRRWYPGFTNRIPQCSPRSLPQNVSLSSLAADRSSARVVPVGLMLARPGSLSPVAAWSPKVVSSPVTVMAWSPAAEADSTSSWVAAERVVLWLLALRLPAGPLLAGRC